MVKKFGIGATHVTTRRKKRPGIHAKTKRTSHKHSVNYIKPYRGQGR
jgi:hypothetical protein